MSEFVPEAWEPGGVGGGAAGERVKPGGEIIPGGEATERNPPLQLDGGAIELPLATYQGAGNGVAIPISKAAFDAQWKNRSQYLAKLRAFDNRMRQQGYLTKDGQELFAARAGLVLDRIGVR